MSLRRKVSAAVSFALFLLALVGSTRGDSMIMVGRGSATCLIFLQESSSNPTWDYIYHSWAEGYMSAINARNTISKTDINLSVNSLQGRQQVDFLKDYCQANPDQTFVFAVASLYHQLELRQQ